MNQFRSSLKIALGLLIVASSPVQYPSLCQDLRSGNDANRTELFHWIAPEKGEADSLGTLTVSRADGPDLKVLQPTVTASNGHLMCVASTWDAAHTSLTTTYLLNGKQVRLTLSLRQGGFAIAGDLASDQPILASAHLDAWDPDLQARAIAVPYYTGSIWYSAVLGNYLNSWWDWHDTHATALSQNSVQYQPKTDGSRNSFHEQFRLVASKNVDEVLPDPGNPASPWRSELAGRVVLDIWGGSFDSIRAGLANLSDYGIRDCVGIIHNWQFAGYDNGLPQHYPANPQLGGGEGLRLALKQGSDDGCLMAVHENYIDYYPDYPAFSTAAIALNSDGTLMKAWLNKQHLPPAAAGSLTSEASLQLPHGWQLVPSQPGTMQIQSYSTKPTWMVRNASTQSPLIHNSYGTSADFIDVLSAAPISSHGDMDVKEPGAAMLTTWMQANNDVWRYERQTHNGPVLGEGLNHWYYSGMLDGVESQLGAGGIPANIDSALPLFVDFDLLHIHPLQVNHGMGYYSRWMHSPAPKLNQIQLDAYRMQEVAFGHAPFVSTWDDVLVTFVESNLLSPVAKMYGTAKVTSIHYHVNGTWSSPSVAARDAAFSKVEIRYDNGLAIVANSAADPLDWNGLRIPQYGWAAKGVNLFAYTALCGQAICDFAQTPTSLFANSRSAQDYQGRFGGDSNLSRLDLQRRIVNFGPVQTDGMISLGLDSNSRWVLHPVPNNRNFTVLLDSGTFPMPLTVSGTGPSGSSSMTPVSHGRYWAIPLNGAHAYTWR